MEHDTQFCPVCQQESSFSMADGLLQCDNCGSLLQGFVQEEQEFEDTQMTKSRAFSSAAESQNRPSKAPKAARYNLGDAAFAYAISMQALLRAQVAWLVDNCGTSEALGGVVRDLWRTYSLRAGLLEPRPPSQLPGEDQSGEEALREEEELATHGRFQPVVDFSGGTAFGGEDEQRQGGAQGDGSGSSGGLTATQLKNTLWSEAPPRVTLELLYLGALILREALQPTDIVRLTARAQLPFLNWPSVAAAALRSYDSSSARINSAAPRKLENSLPSRLLQPKAIPAVKTLMDNAATLASLLGVWLPAINSGALLHRWALELELPKALAEAAAALSQVHLLGSGLLHLQLRGGEAALISPAAGQPYAHLMAAMVLAARLAWGLDGRRALPPGLPPPPADWQHWAADAFRRIERPLPLPASAQQAASLAPDQIEDYLHFCRTVVFPGSDAPDELQRMERIVQAAASAPSSLARRDGSPRGTPSGRGAPLATDEIRRYPAEGQRRGGGAEDAAAPAAPVSGGHRALADEDGTCEGYAAFWASRDRAEPLEVHPEYAALLVVASRLLWVKAPELHALVAQLEQSCLEVEEAMNVSQKSPD